MNAIITTVTRKIIAEQREIQLGKVRVVVGFGLRLCHLRAGAMISRV